MTARQMGRGRKRHHAVFAIIAGAVVFAGWYIYSPRYAVDRLIEAASAENTGEIASRVDIASLRESFRRQALPEASDAASGSLERLGEDVVAMIADPLLEAAVTPKTVGFAIRRFMEKREHSNQNVSGRAGDAEPAWVIRREGLDSFVVRRAEDREGTGMAFRFRRDGLGWTLSEQLLPINGRS